MNNPISFRLPEVQAKELAVVLASSAERHLATLELLLTRKSSPKSDIRRQEGICDKLILACFDLNIYSKGLRQMCGRLEEALNELQNNPESLNDLRRKVLQSTSR